MNRLEDIYHASTFDVMRDNYTEWINNLKKSEMEKIFKVGDRVYDVVWGWGVVTADMGINNIEVKFDTNIYQAFKKDGRYAESSKPTLSFTEYCLQGFSQERLIELPEVGELCLVRDNPNHFWVAKTFCSYNPKNTYPYTMVDKMSYRDMKRIKILD